MEQNLQEVEQVLSETGCNASETQEEEQQVVLETGCSASGAIRQLILNMISTRKSLIECGYKKLIIDASATSMIIEKTNGIKQFIPIQDEINNESDDDAAMVNNNIYFFFIFLF